LKVARALIRDGVDTPAKLAAAVYDEAGNVIETHEHGGDFKDW
jgi:hypothetical protein